MKNDPHIIRFLAYISLFLFFMVLLVASENLIMFFLAWEGVGVTSFLLISFWYTKQAANKAAIKAMVINKIGDVALLVIIVILFLKTRVLDFHSLYSLSGSLIKTPVFDTSETLLLSVMLTLAVITKSAQLFFHSWLIDAIEGPTPVSALLHSATMVTAGIYLYLRLYPCIHLFLYTPVFLLIIGASTALISAITACF